MAETPPEAQSPVVRTEADFPPMESLTVIIPRGLRGRFESFVHKMGWTPEEGVKILLAYGADVLVGQARSAEETYEAWASARAEMAILRQRAYIAAEAIRSLTMNITGLSASNDQYRRSLAFQRARRNRLRRRIADLPAQDTRP
jgi:hypothetical protein